jgi:hypothetical protein
MMIMVMYTVAVENPMRGDGGKSWAEIEFLTMRGRGRRQGRPRSLLHRALSLAPAL